MKSFLYAELEGIQTEMRKDPSRDGLHRVHEGRRVDEGVLLVLEEPDLPLQRAVVVEGLCDLEGLGFRYAQLLNLVPDEEGQ
jgi:hypothetical protein